MVRGVSLSYIHFNDADHLEPICCSCKRFHTDLCSITVRKHGSVLTCIRLCQIKEAFLTENDHPFIPLEIVLE
ncbi:hypothetical protein ScPMuIL_014739 [Solemya velum]